MSMFKKEILVKRLAKKGLIDGSISNTGKYQLRIAVNGRDEPGCLAYPVLYNLHDPSRSECDYFTTRFPTTIKATIEIMKGN